MEYSTILNNLNNNIKKITLSKEEEKKEYLPQFIEQYGSLEKEQNNAIEPFYLNKIIETINQLKSMREHYDSNKAFYTEVARLFAQTYIPLMIQEYEITNEELVAKLYNVASGNGIKIFNKGEAQRYVESFGEQINGDIGAFKFHDTICFTPDSESKTSEVTSEESIMNATRMLSAMIHETFHIIIDVTKEEYFNYENESKLTSGGTILNEGLVEIHALDFAKKYNLIHLPALYYLNNVRICKEIKNLLGKEEFEKLTFNGTYEELIPNELLVQYKEAERIRYFSRKGYTVDSSKIDLSEESRERHK